jgi:hypothetical protein
MVWRTADLSRQQAVLDFQIAAGGNEQAGSR